MSKSFFKWRRVRWNFLRNPRSIMLHSTFNFILFYFVREWWLSRHQENGIGIFRTQISKVLSFTTYYWYKTSECIFLIRFQQVGDPELGWYLTFPPPLSPLPSPSRPHNFYSFLPSFHKPTYLCLLLIFCFPSFPLPAAAKPSASCAVTITTGQGKLCDGHH